MKHRRNLVKVLAPAEGGQLGDLPFETAVGLEVDAALADFHAGGGGRAEPRDELIGAIHHDPAEDCRSGHLETPAAPHRAGDLVARREPLAVEVEPDVAR